MAAVSLMRWNWQLEDWPHFTHNSRELGPLEDRFLTEGGRLAGASAHLLPDEGRGLTAELLSAEALSTSAIEGEVLERDSVRSSIRRQLGLSVERSRAGAAEQGIAEVMVDVYERFADRLDDAQLFRWHASLLRDRDDVDDVGRYRTHAEAMQIVSGAMFEPRVHFEAPPSDRVPAEMKRLVAWFNRTAPGGTEPMRPLARAGTAHVYFESIHPFEDGNGRIGRALSGKALSQALGFPSLAALATVIERRRKEYYAELAAASRTLDLTRWLLWFADVTIEAQAETSRWVTFLIDKAQHFDRFDAELNPRQRKVLLRMARQGPDGFEGGLSAGNYCRIAKTSPATARRDLGKLVEMGALLRTGERKGTRYWLPFGART